MGPYNSTDGILLDQIAGGFAPIVTGRPHQRMTGFEGVPGMDQPGITGALMQAVIAPQLQRMMGNYGFMPSGIGHDRNMYEVMRNRQFTLAQDEAARIASESDRDNYQRTFRGLAAATGTPWGAQQRRAARQLSDTATQFSPVMAEMFPDLLDQMGGMRGSATVMARRMMMMGSRYQIDPVTGQMGMSAQSVGSMAKNVYQDLYESGDVAQMKGISAGQVGTMYDEMARRGMIQGPQSSLNTRTMDATLQLATRDRPALEQAAKNQGVQLPNNLRNMGAEDLEKMRLDPAIDSRLRAFDSERVKRSLKGYVDVIASMRDIFGDMGRPDAPIQELIQKLEALTQGGVGQLDPGRLNTIVRTTQELSKQAGMSIDQTLALQQHAASRAEQLGISPLHAMQATQGALAWGSAYRAQGGAAVPAWGRFNADQMQQLDVNLRVQAGSSEQAQRLGVMMRIHDRVGGFESGSQADAMASAIAAGQTEFLDPTTGKMRSTNMSSNQFSSMLQSAKGRNGSALNIDEGTVTSMLGQRKTNEQFIEKHGIVNQVRSQQAQDSQHWVRERYSDSLSQRLRSAGMDSDQANEIADRASDRIASRVGDLSHADFADDRTRTGKTASIIEEELRLAGANKFIDDKKLGEDYFELTAESTYGHVNDMIRNGQMRGFGNYQNLQASMNAATGNQADRNMMQASFHADISEALSPLGRGTMLQRAVQYMQDAGPDADMTGLISQAFGGVETKEIQEGLQAPLTKVKESQQQLQELQKKYMAAPSGESRTRLLDQIREQSEALRAEVASLVNTSEEFGIFTDGKSMISVEDTQRTLGSLRTLSAGQQDLAGLSGDFAHKVTQGEINSVRGTKFDPKSQAGLDIAAEILLQRRLADAENVDNATAQKHLEKNLEKYSNVDQARADLVNSRRAEVEANYQNREGAFSKTNLENWASSNTVRTDKEAESVILRRRSLTNLQPSEDEVAAYRAKTGASVEVAESALAARARAKRFGITPDEIEAARSRLKPGQQSEEQAISHAIESRMGQQLQVSAGDISEYREAHPESSQLGDDMIQRQIRRERQDVSQKRWKQFWGSDSGSAFRTATDEEMSQVDDMTTRMVMSKGVMRKLGPQSIASFKSLKEKQHRMRELAAQHTGGDMARLVARDLTDISDPATMEAVRQELFDLQGGMTDEVTRIQTALGAKGRDWGDDAESTARLMLGLPKDKSIPLTEEQRKSLDSMVKNIGVAQSLKDEDISALQDFEQTEVTLKGKADQLGITSKELGSYLSAGKLPAGKANTLTPLTEVETALADKVKREWRSSYDKFDRSRSALDARKKALTGETDPDKRVKIEADIARLEKETAAKEQAVTDTFKAVDGLAGARGMSGEEFMQNYDNDKILTQSTYEAMKDIYSKQQARRKELEERAKDISGAAGVDELLGGASAIKRVDEMTQEYRDLENQSQPELLTGLFKRTGLNLEQHREFIGKLGTQTGSETGREFGRRIIGTADKLGEYATQRKQTLMDKLKGTADPTEKAKLERRIADLSGEKVLSSGELIDQYTQAQKDPRELEEFKKSIGLSGKANAEKYSEFENAANFYKWTGMSELDDIKTTEGRATRLANIVQSLDRGVAFRETDKEQQNAAPSSMTLDGTLRIVGDTGDINAEAHNRAR